MEYDVPPEAPLRLMATLVAFTTITDLSTEKDRAALKRVLKEGQGLFGPKVRYECTVDWSAQLLPPQHTSLPVDAEAVEVARAANAALPCALEVRQDMWKIGSAHP